MNPTLDAAWRALLYCLHPRVIALSILPLVLMVAAALGAGYFFWDTAQDSVRYQLESWKITSTALDWLSGVGLGGFRAVLVPMVVLAFALPVIVVVCMLCVAGFMTPAMVSLVAERRFAQLERRKGGSFAVGLLRALASTAVAIVAILLTVPFWLMPLVFLLVPPLIWGWLNYRVMGYDVLAEHASAEERHELAKTHKSKLLLIGIICGYLGAAPSLIWASGALLIPLAPFLIPLAIWIYTLVFAFSALWFAHYALTELERMRAAQALAAAAQAPISLPKDPSGQLPPELPLGLPPV